MPRAVPDDVESIYLDLDQPLAQELQGAFDIVFSHTVAEHIFDPLRTFETLAGLSRDAVIAVVPFAQGVHYTSSYGDYVRLTPLFLKRFFETRDFTVLLSTSNDQPFLPVYTVFIACRHPSGHLPHFADAPLEFEPQLTGGRFGRRIVTGLNAPADLNNTYMAERAARTTSALSGATLAIRVSRLAGGRGLAGTAGGAR